MSFGLEGTPGDQVSHDELLARLSQIQEQEALSGSGSSAAANTNSVVRSRLGGSSHESPSNSLVGSGGPQGPSPSKVGPPPATKPWGATNVVVNNIVNCCSLGSEGWLKVFAAITLIVAVALVAFLGCYSAGLFHFEKFIGPIGASVTLGGAGALVVLSGMVLLLSFKK